MISHIVTKNEDKVELEVVILIKELCSEFDIPAFTHQVMVDKDAIPHSHPILTLNTKSLDKRTILKNLVHEQLHWYAQSHPNYGDCIDYLKSKYSEDGEHNRSGTYPNSYWEHIVVIFNTRGYLKKVLSNEDLIFAYEQWTPYPTLEKYVEEEFSSIRKDLIKFNMVAFNT